MTDEEGAAMVKALAEYAKGSETLEEALAEWQGMTALEKAQVEAAYITLIVRPVSLPK
jgi:hypothetical protein